MGVAAFRGTEDGMEEGTVMNKVKSNRYGWRGVR